MAVDPGSPNIAVEPASTPDWLRDAVREGGGTVLPLDKADALIWSDPKDPDGLAQCMAAAPDLQWVQLTYAGVEPFSHLLDDKRVWSCGKGVYAAPVAEHALALALAGLRHVGAYARAQSWQGPAGKNLDRARVTILGGGEITRVLLDLLAPFDCDITVVRNRPDALNGARAVVGSDQLPEALPGADLIVLALALTPDTDRIIGKSELFLMEPDAWLVNVARGRHIHTEALVEALQARQIGGAALDVTEPEPLPDGHPLWSLDNAIITPHVGNTPEMAMPLLAERVRENVRRWIAGEELLGPVYLDLGY